MFFVQIKTGYDIAAGNLLFTLNLGALCKQQKCCQITLSVFVGMFFSGVLLTIVCLHLIYLIDVQGAQRQSENQAEPAVVEEIIAGHACH